METNSDFGMDIEKEKKFLAEILKFKLGEVGDKSGIANELLLMIKVYNEVLEGMVRSRIDLEIFNHLIIVEPMERTHLDKKVQTEKALIARRKVIDVIRGQILDMVGGLNKSGK